MPICVGVSDICKTAFIDASIIGLVTLLHGSPGWTASGRLVWGRALDRRGAPAMPFKANRDCRIRIPKQRHQVTNWATYDASLRARGSLTVWFTAEAMEAWKAEPRSGRGGQPRP